MSTPAADGRGLGVCVLLAATALLACEREAGEPEAGPVTRIPQHDRVVRPGTPADSVTTRDPSAESRPSPPAIPGTVGPDTLEVGSLDGSGGVVFGEITDVAVVESSSVVVLDGQSKRLISIDVSTGAVTGELGGEGQGPREFAIPRGLAYDGVNDRLFAVDALGELKVYSLGESRVRPSFVESVDLPPGTRDACVVGDTLYLHSEGVGDGGVVAPFHYEEGAARRSAPSFGEVYDPVRPDAGWRMRKGLLACSPEKGTVAFAPAATGDLRMYSRRGELLWYSVLDEFRPITTYLKPDGGVKQVIPEDDGFASPHALVLTSNGGAVLQVARITRRSRRQERPYEELQTYLFSPTGQGEHVGPSNVRFWHLGDEFAVASRTLPYPRIFIIHRTGG